MRVEALAPVRVEALAPVRVEALDLAAFDEFLDKPVPSPDTVVPSRAIPAGPKESGPFVLSNSLPVVPAKLAKMITKREYVDLSELLNDNIEVDR